MLIAIPIPHNFFPSWEFVKPLLKVAPRYRITYSEGPYIYDNRNRFIKLAKKLNEDLLMIDSDIIFTEEDVDKIYKKIGSYPAISGLYNLKPNLPAVFKRTKDDYEYTEPPKKFDKVAAVGAGFLAISNSLLRRLPDNACDNIYESSMHGEDISLCHRINELGESIYLDPEIKLGHLRVGVV